MAEGVGALKPREDQYSSALTDVVLIVPEIPHSCFKNYYNLESIKLVLTYFFELSSSGSRVSFNGQLGASNRTKANSIEIF